MTEYRLVTNGVTFRIERRVRVRRFWRWTWGPWEVRSRGSYPWPLGEDYATRDEAETDLAEYRERQRVLQLPWLPVPNEHDIGWPEAPPLPLPPKAHPSPTSPDPNVSAPPCRSVTLGIEGRVPKLPPPSPEPAETSADLSQPIDYQLPRLCHVCLRDINMLPSDVFLKSFVTRTNGVPRYTFTCGECRTDSPKP